MRVTRRDGESLVLMSQREAESRTRLLSFAAQLITVALDDGGSLAERMSKAFPWMLALSPADRRSCTQDLIDAARASGRGAVVGYLPVGFPDLPTSIDAAVALIDAGFTALELGLPYSDPVIDGLLARGSATMDDEAREAIWRDAVAYYARQEPMIQLLQYVNTWAHRRGLVHEPRMDERTLAMGVRPAR